MCVCVCVCVCRHVCVGFVCVGAEEGADGLCVCAQVHSGCEILNCSLLDGLTAVCLAAVKM